MSQRDDYLIRGYKFRNGKYFAKLIWNGDPASDELTEGSADDVQAFWRGIRDKYYNIPRIDDSLKECFPEGFVEKEGPPREIRD